MSETVKSKGKVCAKFMCELIIGNEWRILKWSPL